MSKAAKPEPHFEIHALRMPFPPAEMEQLAHLVTAHIESAELRDASRAFTSAIHDYATEHEIGPATMVAVSLAAIAHSIEACMARDDSREEPPNGTLMATAIYVYAMMARQMGVDVGDLNVSAQTGRA